MSGIDEENMNDFFENPAETREIRTSVPINGLLQKRISRNLQTLSIVDFVLGAVAFVATVLCDIFLFSYYRILYYMILGLSIFFIVKGILWFQTNKSVKNAAKQNIKQQYVFTEQYVTIYTIRQGETTGIGKTFYTNSFKIKDTKEFFLLYLNTTSVYPVDKKVLSEEEISELRRILRLKKKC